MGEEYLLQPRPGVGQGTNTSTGPSLMSGSPDNADPLDASGLNDWFAAPVGQSTATSPNGNPGGGSAYTTSWLDNAPKWVRDDVDMQYSFEKGAAASPEVKAIEAELKKVNKKKDPARHAELTQKREELIKKLAASDEIRQGKVGHTGKLDGAESTDDRIFTEELSREEGRGIVRDNFMNEMAGLLGGQEKVEQWFGQIGPTSVPGKPLLHRSAGARLEAAAASFKQQYPGVDFLSSTVAFSMRARQNTRQGKGMLSHATGMAIDYKAYENPHLKDWQNRVLLETVTGGPSRLVFEDPQGNEYNYGQRRKIISQLGKDKAAGNAHNAQGDAFIQESFDAGFDKFVRTEQDFRTSLDVDGNGADNEIAALRKVAEEYWGKRGQIVSTGKQLGTASKKLGTERKAAHKRIQASHLKELDGKISKAKTAVSDAAKGEGRKAGKADFANDPTLQSLTEERQTWAKQGPSAQQVDADEKVAAILAQVTQLKEQLDALKRPFTEALERQLAPWLAKFDERIAAYQPALAGFDPENLPTQKLVDQALAVVKAAKTARDPARALQKLTQDAKYGVLLQGVPEATLQDPALLKAHLTSTLAKVKAAGAAKSSIEALRTVRDRLRSDLDFTLGSSDKNTVSDPSALQLMEVGVVYNGGALPRPAAQADAASQSSDDPQVQRAQDPDLAQSDYFREFTRTLMEHGFECGGAWETADTMHFEFAEGMDELQGNAQGKTFGPLGTKTKS